MRVLEISTIKNGHKEDVPRTILDTLLVVFHHPFAKYARQIWSIPQLGVNIKNILSCHHQLDIMMFLLLCDSANMNHPTKAELILAESWPRHFRHQDRPSHPNTSRHTSLLGNHEIQHENLVDLPSPNNFHHGFCFYFHMLHNHYYIFHFFLSRCRCQFYPWTATPLPVTGCHRWKLGGTAERLVHFRWPWACKRSAVHEPWAWL